MKLLEKVLYSGILFLAVYVVLSLGLRLFSLTSDFNSHMIGGIAATVFSMLLFMYLLLKKQDEN